MSEKTITTYLALLRGINVGGNNKISMADLKTYFEQLGYGNVQTYGNSGNLIFTTTATDPEQLEEAAQKALVAGFAGPIRVFVRSFAEVGETVAGIPQDWQDSAERKYDVIFLGKSIDSPEIVEKLQPKPAIDQLYYRPGVLFWSVKTRDFSKSNLGKLVGTPVYQEMTIRSPGVVRKVFELMGKLNSTL